MAPVSPYTTPAITAIMLQHMFRGIAPGVNTPVTESVMEQLINWTASIVETRFAGVGYEIPFTALTGEAWPGNQTTLLQFVTSCGSAAMASGYILQPAPQTRPGSRGGELNVFAALFENFFVALADGKYSFRAMYRRGTKAEKFLSEMQAPRLDFLQNHIDPTRYQTVREYADMMNGIFGDVSALNIDWDYAYLLRTET